VTRLRNRVVFAVVVLTCACTPAFAKYSGGTGEPNDPYQIASATDLIALGNEPNDYAKHFILTADIDLDPNLPGRKIFDKAIIGTYVIVHQAWGNVLTMVPFSGTFDGGGHTISHLTITGTNYLGLFGQLLLKAEVRRLGIVNVSIVGSDSYVGALAGKSEGLVEQCFSEGGTVSGRAYVGGLVGWNDHSTVSACCSAVSVRGVGTVRLPTVCYIGGVVGGNSGGVVSDCRNTGPIVGSGSAVGGVVGDNDESTVAACCNTGSVEGRGYVGGVVGRNYKSTISGSYSTGPVEGGECVGGLAGSTYAGAVSACHSTGFVRGTNALVGGLLGGNNGGTVSTCYSTGSVSSPGRWVGGLAGCNGGTVFACYSAGPVDGNDWVGGLVGWNQETISASYSTGRVDGNDRVGGLTGQNEGDISACYSTGPVDGNDRTGGLVGYKYDGTISASFWDIETSGQTANTGGIGKPTGEMRAIKTFLDAGWDFEKETANGMEDVWWIDEGKDHPRLWWDPRKYGGGTGEPDHPYLICTAEQMNAVGAEPNDWDKCFRLMADIDMSGFDGENGRPAFNVIAPCDAEKHLLLYWDSSGVAFTGVFDGNGHQIRHLMVHGGFGGLFGGVVAPAVIRSLGIVDANISGTNSGVGALAGWNSGAISRCYSTGTVSGGWYVGGLVGFNWTGSINQCCSTCIATGDSYVGGLVGDSVAGTVIRSYSEGAVDGNFAVGGLLGANESSKLSECYSVGKITGASRVGGLVGFMDDTMTGYTSFWDTQTSGQAHSAQGMGRTTYQMQGAMTFIDNGWGFDVNETDSDTWYAWTIDEGHDYPRLWWEHRPGSPLMRLDEMLCGTGEKEYPYEIRTAYELNLIGLYPDQWDKCFVLMDDIDMSGIAFNVIAPNLSAPYVGGWRWLPETFPGTAFTGVFDGNGHAIRHVTVDGGRGGLFGGLGTSALVKNLGIVDISTGGTIYGLGGLAGWNSGTVSGCYCTGAVSGDWGVGGLVGVNASGTMTQCYTSCSVVGHMQTAGLAGSNAGGRIAQCYSIGSVFAYDSYFNGMVGVNTGTVLACFWDVQTSSQCCSTSGGTGLRTAQMQTAQTFLDAGWDFVGETANGTADIWWIEEGKDYPRLSWEDRGKFDF
jgi:hypothetical protein